MIRYNDAIGAVFDSQDGIFWMQNTLGCHKMSHISVSNGTDLDQNLDIDNVLYPFHNAPIGIDDTFHEEFYKIL